MERVKTILFATDFSEHSKHAWQYALHEAQLHNARLVVAHVIQRMVIADPLLLDAVTHARVYETLKKFAEEQLHSVQEEATLAGLECKTLILEGTPFIEIIRWARETEADVIVLGSHGTTGLASMLLGSTTERVVRKAPCSVMVVKQKGWEFRMP